MKTTAKKTGTYALPKAAADKNELLRLIDAEYFAADAFDYQRRNAALTARLIVCEDGAAYQQDESNISAAVSLLLRLAARCCS